MAKTRPQKKEYDVVDVHVTGENNSLHAMVQYPLLDGTKQYTVEVTEFVCPISQQSPLPSNKFFAQDTGMFFRLRRKNVGNPPNSDHTLMPGNMVGPMGGVGGTLNADMTEFRKNSQRPIRTVGDLAYYMQRFFDDVKAAYISTAVPPVDLLLGLEHGGIPNVRVTQNTPFVTVRLLPNSSIILFLSPLFTKHFYIEMSDYGTKMLGLSTDNTVAFRTAAGVVLTGFPALTNGTANVVAGAAVATVEFTSLYPVERHFEHRERVEVRTDMGIPPTVVWDVDDKETYSFVIATFPVVTTTTTAVKCNNLGVTTDDTIYTNSLLSGNINFRKAEDKVTERYLILNSQYFHNIRLQLYIVRKDWNPTTKVFVFTAERLEFEEGQTWTAKLRFRSI